MLQTITNSIEFTESILNTITDHIVVIDRHCNIQFVNRSWVKFGEDNNCLTDSSWKGVNYLEACEKSAEMGDEYGRKAAEGIRKAINSELDIFYFEYPCHSPEEKRWFMMRVTPFRMQEADYYVISHQNITERKIAEEEVLSLSRIDGLTKIPNRRRFDEFLDSEWRRCARLKMPVTLAMIDIDHFKLLNDTYGHQAGDETLKKIGAVLKGFANRPGDICARYGGEEFAIVHGNTALEDSLTLIERLLDSIRKLKIPNKDAPTMPIVTASAGVATMDPALKSHPDQLIKAADTLLYKAKSYGRNQVVSRGD